MIIYVEEIKTLHFDLWDEALKKKGVAASPGQSSQ